ncbi:MAG TPA: polyprenyl synthetase family protein, partial [Chloroflexia bacterium]|nr:polyprenyl synthetase family protein [Chloroflexia bacterium]
RDPRYAEHFAPAHSREAIYHYLGRHGKALRPLMLLLSCGAAGGDEARALPAAAAVELFHTWTLVHDDIIDRDDLRRGQPTVHAAFAARARADWDYPASEAAHYGVTTSILAGDQQQGWAYALLAELPERGVTPAVALSLIRDMALVLEPGLLAGEMLDVQYSHRPIAEVSEDAILDMLTRKTALLYGFAARAGAAIGLDAAGQSGSPEGVTLTAALERFAGLCGLAFQLQDDLLGITGDEARLGKPIGSDLREGKKTVIIHHALTHAPHAVVVRVRAVLGNAAATPAEVEATVRLLEDSGSIAYVRGLSQDYVTQALAQLSMLPDTPNRKLLYLWARYLVAREF